jgi:hypothetical protein
MRYIGLFKLTLLLFLLINGCGSSPLQNAKTTVSSLGIVWMQIDESFSKAYEKARIDARESSNTWEERDEKLEAWEKGRKAVEASGMALKSAALAISIADQEPGIDWKKQTEQALEALQAAFTALELLDLKIPASAKKTLETARLLFQSS